MSLHVRQINLPNEIILEVSKHLSNEDYLTFKSSCKQVYSALNHSKREALSKKTRKLSLNSLLTLDQSFPKSLYDKSFKDLTFFELDKLDRVLKINTLNNFTSLKSQGGLSWKEPGEIVKFARNLASINEKEPLESLLKADTSHEIGELHIKEVFLTAASLGHLRVVNLLLSNESGHLVSCSSLEEGLRTSALNKHSSVVKEILNHPRIEEVSGSVFSRAFFLSTVWAKGTSPNSEGFTNSFNFFLESNKFKNVSVDHLFGAIANLVKFKLHASADALLKSERVKSKSFAAILLKAIISKDFELFTYLMSFSKKSLLTFSGFKNALLTSCEERAAPPYFVLAQHQFFKELSKNDLKELLNLVKQLPLQNNGDSLAICHSLDETFSKKKKN